MVPEDNKQPSTLYYQSNRASKMAWMDSCNRIIAKGSHPTVVRFTSLYGARTDARAQFVYQVDGARKRLWLCDATASEILNKKVKLSWKQCRRVTRQLVARNNDGIFC